MNKIKPFEKFLDTFENDEMRNYCKDMIELSDDYIWKIPSSTSLKYHNKTQCQPGGQLYHILMACEIMNYILGLKYVKDKYDKPKQRDCFRIAICLHDMKKTGGGQFTVHEHPVLVQKWIENTSVDHDIDEKLKKYIGRLCASHSGEWTTSNKSDFVLPEIENDEQFLVHLCDYLASRNNIDMIYSDSLKEIIESFQDLPDINSYQLTFGKHAGKTLVQIKNEDPSYILWMQTQELRYPVNELLKTI